MLRNVISLTESNSPIMSRYVSYFMFSLALKAFVMFVTFLLIQSSLYVVLARGKVPQNSVHWDLFKTQNKKTQTPYCVLHTLRCMDQSSASLIFPEISCHLPKISWNIDLCSEKIISEIKPLLEIAILTFYCLVTKRFLHVRIIKFAGSLHCTKSARIRSLLWSEFSCIRAEYGEIWSISPYSLRMRENAYQNNSKYGHFSRSACQEKLFYIQL